MGTDDPVGRGHLPVEPFLGSWNSQNEFSNKVWHFGSSQKVARACPGTRSPGTEAQVQRDQTAICHVFLFGLLVAVVVLASGSALRHRA